MNKFYLKMHLAYLILAHKNPEQLHRLVARLHHPDDYFYIHIDKKVDIEPFQKVFENSGYHVEFISKRENGRWGDIGLVKATINGLYELIESKLNFTHISLLSGQDYPIKPLVEIREFFARNPDKSFLEYTPFPVPHLEYGGLHRIESYSFNIGKRRETYIPFKWKNHFNYKGKIQNLLLGIVCLFLPKRKMPNDWLPYYGSQWWSLNRDAVQCIINMLNEYPNYTSYHKYVLIPDEMFFQSILLNNFDENLLINNNYRFIDWSSDSSHPKILSINEISQIVDSNKLFARKFDMNALILNKIDNEFQYS